MIPKVNGRGHSFKGVVAYLMHDKDHAPTCERVGWYEIGNIPTEDPEKAARIMAWTEQTAAECKEHNTGRKSTAGNVYHYSLSWAHGETPDRDHMHGQALETLERLGLGDNQYMVVAHDDTDHAHLHIVVNLVHPETGKVHSLSYDRPALQTWALEYEKAHVMHCVQREKNALEREQGTPLKHRDQKQDYSRAVTQAYQQCDNGVSFQHALREQGLELAAARRGAGFLIVDANGDVQKLGRQLDIDEKGKAKTTAINAKLGDIDRAALPDADQLAKQRREATEAKKQPEKEAQTPPIPAPREPVKLSPQEAINHRATADKADSYMRLSVSPPPITTPPVPPREPPRMPLHHVTDGVERLEATAAIIGGGLSAIGRMVDAIVTWTQNSAAMLYEQLSGHRNSHAATMERDNDKGRER